MASGDLTASTPVLATTPTEIKAAIDALNLTAVTDLLQVIPKGNGHLYFQSRTSSLILPTHLSPTIVVRLKSSASLLR
jgi:hypothetical protein